MEKITKELKHATFEYDEKTKEFTILTDPNNYYTGRNNIKLNKIYAFAFTRFVIRISQRNWLRSNKTIEQLIEEEIQEDENQLKLFKDE